VKDSGSGVNENLKENLFKLFTSQSSFKKKRHGVGIGLTVSNKMA
jgi:K+-sensing histidine kinase KdpD